MMNVRSMFPTWLIRYWWSSQFRTSHFLCPHHLLDEEGCASVVQLHLDLHRLSVDLQVNHLLFGFQHSQLSKPTREDQHSTTFLGSTWRERARKPRCHPPVPQQSRRWPQSGWRRWSRSRTPEMIKNIHHILRLEAFARQVKHLHSWLAWQTSQDWG